MPKQIKHYSKRNTQISIFHEREAKITYKIIAIQNSATYEAKYGIPSKLNSNLTVENLSM